MTQKKTTSSPAFDQFFHALPGLYLVMTPDLYIVEVTDDFVQTVLYARDQLVGRYIFDVFPPAPTEPGQKASEDFEKSLQYVLEHKKTHSMPIIRYDTVVSNHPHHTYRPRYWKARNIPILDIDGSITHILHETWEVTEEELLKQEKSHNKEHLRLLAKAVKAVNWESDLETNTLHWNDGLTEVLGYTHEAMGNSIESWDLRVHPDDLPAVRESLEKAKAAGSRTWSAEYRFRRASGTYAYILDNGYILYNEGGKPVRVIGSMVDVSASKQSEIALKESNTRLHQLIEALPYMAWTADAKGRVQYYNQNWYSYTGMQKGQTEGWINFMHPEDSAHVLTAWIDALDSGYYQVECRVRHYLDGSYRWFLEQAVPIRDETGNIQLWLGTYTDVDERMQALEQLEGHSL